MSTHTYPATGTHTITLHRILRCPPERVFRAFTTASAWAKWLPPHGFTAEVHQLEAQVGGRWRMSFVNHANGGQHSFGGEYLAIDAPHLLRYDSAFDDPGLPGRMVTTVRLSPSICGTELQVEQAGIPAMIPAAACHLGWQESLSLLAQLVEADIPAGQ